MLPPTWHVGRNYIANREAVSIEGILRWYSDTLSTKQQVIWCLLETEKETTMVLHFPTIDNEQVIVQDFHTT
jgi:hypothetical protein